MALRFTYNYVKFYGRHKGINLLCNMYLYSIKSQKQNTQLVRMCLHWCVCTFVSRCYFYNFGRRSVFGIATTLRAGRTPSSNSGRGNRIHHIQTRRDQLWAIQPLVQQVVGLINYTHQYMHIYIYILFKKSKIYIKT